MISCPFSRKIWHETLSWLRMTCPPPSDEATLFDWWTTADQITPKPMRKGLASTTMLVPLLIWKQRNDCIFGRGQPYVQNLMSKIKEEASAWMHAGAKGLRVVVPTTWH